MRYWWVFMLLLPLSLSGADVLESKLYLDAGLSLRYQCIPREHIYVSDADSEMVCVVGRNSGVWYDIVKLTDHGATLEDSMQVAGATSFNEHVHIEGRGDSVYAMGNVAGDDRNRFYRINVSSMTIIDSAQIDSSSLDDALATIALYGDSMMLVNRLPGASLAATYWASGDRGETWPDGGEGTDVYNYSVNIRVDAERFGDSVSLIVYNTSSNAFDWFYYDPGTGWSSKEEIVDNDRSVRHFAHEIGKDEVAHLLYADTATPSHLIHYWRNPSGGAWTADTLYTASAYVTIAGFSGFWPVLNYTESSETMRAIYGTAETDGDVDAVVCRKWNYTTDDWESDSLVLSSGTADSVSLIGGCLNVPSIHNDRSYVVFQERVSGSWGIYLAAIADSGNGEAAGNKVMILK